MQEIDGSNPPVVTGIYDPDNFGARNHRSLMIVLFILHLLSVLLISELISFYFS